MNLSETEPGLNLEAFRAFRSSTVARQLFARTLRHPELGHLVAWAPTEWLVTLANPEPLEDTTTSGADGEPDRRVDLSELYDGMLKHGMRDPLVLGTGLDKRTRLEEGNQRVRCFVKKGIVFAPIVSYVNDTAITNPENGPHRGRYLETMGNVVLALFHRNYTSPLKILNEPLIAETDFSENLQWDISP